MAQENRIALVKLDEDCGRGRYRLPRTWTMDSSHPTLEAAVEAYKAKEMAHADTRWEVAVADLKLYRFIAINADGTQNGEWMLILDS